MDGATAGAGSNGARSRCWIARLSLFGIVVILVTYGVLAIAALRYEWESRAGLSGAVKMIWAFLPGLVMLGFCAICLYSQIHPAPPPPYN